MMNDLLAGIIEAHGGMNRIASFRISSSVRI